MIKLGGIEIIANGMMTLDHATVQQVQT